MAVVVGLDEVDAGQVALVGGKAAGLGELIQAGERVPPGFCITAAAHDSVVVSSGVLPEELRRQIVQAYERLGAGAVAVRSSATTEDLAHASFAGQYETVLNVSGAEGADPSCAAVLGLARERAGPGLPRCARRRGR
jgi:pyruvate,water dikinase